jgi:hypothetical protein
LLLVSLILLWSVFSFLTNVLLPGVPATALHGPASPG